MQNAMHHTELILICIKRQAASNSSSSRKGKQGRESVDHVASLSIFLITKMTPRPNTVNLSTRRALKVMTGLLAIGIVVVILAVVCEMLKDQAEAEATAKPLTPTVKIWSKVEIDGFAIESQAELSKDARRLPAPSVLLDVQGVLGNQLFQFASSYALARKLNFPLYVRVPDEKANATRKFGTGDQSFVLDLFKIPFSPNRSVTTSVGRLVELSDQDVLTQTYESWSNLGKYRLWMAGDGQIESVFSRYQEDLIKMLQVRKQVLSSKYSAMSEKIRQSNCSICMQFYRGPFENEYQRAPVSYYPEALKKLGEVFRRRNFQQCLNRCSRKTFIFSDFSFKALEGEFGEDFFENLQPFETVSGQGLSSIEEFKLMSECDHIIIPDVLDGGQRISTRMRRKSSLRQLSIQEYLIVRM